MNLEEWNKQKQGVYIDAELALALPRKNGLTCKCGAELHDADRLLRLSRPPMRAVHCPKCGFDGYRVA